MNLDKKKNSLETEKRKFFVLFFIFNSLCMKLACHDILMIYFFYVINHAMNINKFL